MARLKRAARQMPVAAAFGGVTDAGEAPLMRGLVRGLEVLGAFRAEDRYLGNIELSERTGLPRSTVSRLCATLMRLGYMTYSPTRGRYALGPCVVTLSRSLLDNMANRFAASPVLRRLADTLRLPVSLGMLEHVDIVYIETARHAASRPARFDLGTRLPLETTAIGRAYLAGLDQGEREALVALLRSRVPDAQWPALQRSLEKAVADVAEHGFCRSSEEWRRDVVGVAAPVPLDDGTMLAINCGGTLAEVPAHRTTETIGPLLVEGAREIARRAAQGDDMPDPAKDRGSSR